MMKNEVREIFPRQTETGGLGKQTGNTSRFGETATQAELNEPSVHITCL